MSDGSVGQWESADEEVRENLQPGERFALTPVDCLSMVEMRSDWVSLERSTVPFRDSFNACRRFIPFRLEDRRNNGVIKLDVRYLRRGED